MGNKRELDRQEVYQIRVKGLLDNKWSDWFNGMNIASEIQSDGSPITKLTGAVIDQVALHGILSKIRDLNLELISVNQIEMNSKNDS